MRKLVLLACFFMPVLAHAGTYLVFQFSQNTRIVLSQTSCLVNGLTGNRAAVQRDDGKFIRGCWKYVDNDQHVRIDWENPAKPGDFAVLRAKDFTAVTE